MNEKTLFLVGGILLGQRENNHLLRKQMRFWKCISHSLHKLNLSITNKVINLQLQFPSVLWNWRSNDLFSFPGYCPINIYLKL